MMWDTLQYFNISWGYHFWDIYIYIYGYMGSGNLYQLAIIEFPEKKCSYDHPQISHLRPSAEKTLSRLEGLSTSVSTDCLRLTAWIGSFSIIQLFKNQRMKNRRQGISKFWSRPGTCRRQKLVYPKSEVAKKALSKSPSIDSTSSKVPKISQIPQSICVFVWFFSHDPSLEDGTVISAALTAAWWQVQRTKRSRLQPGKGLV